MSRSEDPKARFLASRGALHPHPERVRDRGSGQARGPLGRGEAPHGLRPAGLGRRVRHPAGQPLVNQQGMSVRWGRQAPEGLDP